MDVRRQAKRSAWLGVKRASVVLRVPFPRSGARAGPPKLLSWHASFAPPPRSSLNKPPKASSCATSSLAWSGVRFAVSASSAPAPPCLLTRLPWRFVWLASSLEVPGRSLRRPAKRLREQARRIPCVTNPLLRRRKCFLHLPREQSSPANSRPQTPILFVWLARSLACSRKSLS